MQTQVMGLPITPCACGFCFTFCRLYHIFSYTPSMLLFGVLSLILSYKAVCTVATKLLVRRLQTFCSHATIKL
ncbi:hypothetical protein HMPREF1991_02052 [Hoylesella loescheii DSM 19665 = JCM 12249 = ATCC 15930]|uniref:Uncharacterized protein n=1 Tax=Hoylesella loescheii DSM 19665 = JCM 12249 = ATCC 15930 TaxID=1122985 RepID=A0A069QIL0_HOYLO|nr:hypothetical protein HMPREF1991_02052 [Hoylesella loescheii DSM 19665 = JCM 12249 = ATCC 15930]